MTYDNSIKILISTYNFTKKCLCYALYFSKNCSTNEISEGTVYIIPHPLFNNNPRPPSPRFSGGHCFKLSTIIGKF